ncbi:MAG: carbohydrate ABC transporter permease [Spirochaetales bacterium]
MKSSASARVVLRLGHLVTVVLVVVFLVPFYFVFVNSFKPLGEILTNTAGLPAHWDFQNFPRTFQILSFGQVLLSSFIVTALTVLGLVFFSATAAYQLLRQATRTNRVLFSVLVASMIIPFPSLMIPLVTTAGKLGIQNSYAGLVLTYLGLGLPFAIFLYHGFIKSIPVEIEEAAIIDGCGPHSVFWRVVFPLLQPITVTVALLNGLQVWNDFLLPSLILSRKALWTIPLSINSLFSQYNQQWDKALPGLAMSILPVLAMFLFAQKHIITGISQGAIKG